MLSVYQFKYNNENDIPKDNILKELGPVVTIGLLGPAGTKFTINNGGDIEIGSFGRYELDLSKGDLGRIVSLQIKSIGEYVSEHFNLVIDVVYEEAAVK